MVEMFGSEPTPLPAGDINGDGAMDMLVPNAEPDKVIDWEYIIVPGFPAPADL
jgi:hypothetical protein